MEELREKEGFTCSIPFRLIALPELFPTCANNILDLLLTSHLITNVQTIPGISDREVVSYQLNFRGKSLPDEIAWPIYLYYKCNTTFNLSFSPIIHISILLKKTGKDLKVPSTKLY